MNNRMKGFFIFCISACFLGFTGHYVSEDSGKYYQIDSLLSVKFYGDPVKTYCQSALGEVTSYKYDSQYNSADSNYICEASYYMNINTDTLKHKGVDFFEYIIDSEEMSMRELNGKFLEKKDSVFRGIPAKVLKVYFADLKSKSIQECINKNIYFTYNHKVFKISTYIPVKGKLDISGSFFGSVRIGKF